MSFILLILFSVNSFSREDYQINTQYRGGNTLIYNCNQKIFICTSDAGKKECDENRKEAMENKFDHYPCAVLKTFDTKKECLEKNYEVANINALKKYCFLDRLKH